MKIKEETLIEIFGCIGLMLITTVTMMRDIAYTTSAIIWSGAFFYAIFKLLK